MRVAIIIPRLEQLGPIISTQELVNSLFETGKLYIKLFYLDKTVDPLIKVIAPVERLDQGNFPFDDYDIIHTSGIRPDLFAFRNRKKIKYHISTIRNFVFDDLAFTYNRFISFIFGYVWLILWKRADKLVCVSEAVKCYYEKWFPSSKLEVIYNGIAESDDSLIPDNDIIQTIERFRSKGLKVIGCACILTKRKGIDQVLNMLAEEKNYSLVIIGKGREQANLKSLAKKTNIADRCYFPGFRNNAVNFFRYFDIVVIPSRSEGFGRVLIEAVQQKVPVVCSDLDVFEELFNNEEVTFFKLNNIDSIASALREALESGPEKVNIAYLKYQNSYTANNMAKRYLELYQSAS
jgi:L-malate glycosyltransferase